VLLRGTKREEVERGQVLAKPGSITPHTDFTAEVYVRRRRRVVVNAVFQRVPAQFYFRTTDVTGSIQLPAARRWCAGDNIQMTVALMRRSAMEGPALRGARGGRTVGRRRRQDHQVGRTAERVEPGPVGMAAFVL